MATFIIGTILFGAFALVGYKTYKDHKQGKGCSGGCSKCAQAKKCNSNHQE